MGKETIVCSFYYCYVHNFQLKKLGFTGGADGKESAFIAGDLNFIPGLGRPLEK